MALRKQKKSPSFSLHASSYKVSIALLNFVSEVVQMTGQLLMTLMFDKQLLKITEAKIPGDE